MLSDFTENVKYVYLKSSNGSVNFGLMAAAWSKLCSPSNYIYYKTPEHLYSYYNILEDRKKYRDTVAYNINASRSIRLLGQCKRRYVSSEQTKKYRRLEPSLLTCTSIVSTSTTEVAKEAPVNIAPRPSAIEPPIEIVEPIVITRGSLKNEVLNLSAPYLEETILHRKVEKEPLENAKYVAIIRQFAKAVQNQSSVNLSVVYVQEKNALQDMEEMKSAHSMPLLKQ
ncbi:hypothetical protein BD560DRAFT_428276 [Blakeslea trispora]|nr:hypothetical protein BD560DRAFT_428276 [Blakeslea trispora]